MLAAQDTTTSVNQPSLRPGLYALTLQLEDNAQKLFIIFWPEDTTWNDDAISTVQRNRVTFMRCVLTISHLIHKPTYVLIRTQVPHKDH